MAVAAPEKLTPSVSLLIAMIYVSVVIAVDFIPTGVVTVRSDESARILFGLLGIVVAAVALPFVFAVVVRRRL
jgi:hypothetical protein